MSHHVLATTMSAMNVNTIRPQKSYKKKKKGSKHMASNTCTLGLTLGTTLLCIFEKHNHNYDPYNRPDLKKSRSKTIIKLCWPML